MLTRRRKVAEKTERGPAKGSRGIILVTLVMGMMLFGILGTSMVYVTANNLASSNEDLEGSQAFYIAEGGVQYVAMSQLNGDTNFSDNVPPTDPPFGANAIALGSGKFWVEYSGKTASGVTVKVTSQVGKAVRIVQQNVSQGGSGYQYVTLAGGNLTLSGSNGHIYGDVGIKGSASIPAAVTVYGNVVQDPTLTLPTINFQTYKDMTTSTIAGNHTFSSNYTGNVYVTGNVTFNAGVTFNGLLYAGGNVSFAGNNVTINGTIVAEGNVNGDGRTGLQFISQTSGSQHMPAILNKSNFSFRNSDGLKISGVTWNPGNMDFSTTDNLDFTGSFMVGGNVALMVCNNLKITFASDLMTGVPGMSNPGGGGSSTGSLSLSGWKTYAPWW